MTDGDDAIHSDLVPPGLEFLGQTESALIRKYPYLLKYDRRMRRKKLWKLAISDWSDRKTMEALDRMLNERPSEELP
jgi:hypothetical protein